MKAVAHQRRRFGYRRIGMMGVMPERKGMTMNHKKLYRLYADEKLGVRRRRGEETGARVTHANARGAAARRTLVAGLPVGYVWRIPQVPHFGSE